MRWISFLFLLGCPVEPKDIQDLNQNQGKEAGPGKQNPQLVDGKPPGTPPKDKGDVVPLPPPNPMGDGDTPGLPAELGTGENVVPVNSQEDGTAMPTQNQPGGMIEGDGAQSGTANQNGNGEKPGNLPVQSGEMPLNEDGSAVPPSTAGDVLPMYQQLPTFDEIIKDGDTIKLNLTVSGASTFDIEFVVQREGEGRNFPKVIHKQTMTSSPAEITLPANYSEEVWLIITADKTGDGPTPDDLVGGPSAALSFGDSDLSLDYTLTADEAFLKSLPWFSQAADTPASGGF